MRTLKSARRCSFENNFSAAEKILHHFENDFSSPKFAEKPRSAGTRVRPADAAGFFATPAPLCCINWDPGQHLPSLCAHGFSNKKGINCWAASTARLDVRREEEGGVCYLMLVSSLIAINVRNQALKLIDTMMKSFGARQSFKMTIPFRLAERKKPTELPVSTLDNLITYYTQILCPATDKVKNSLPCFSPHWQSRKTRGRRQEFWGFVAEIGTISSCIPINV